MKMTGIDKAGNEVTLELSDTAQLKVSIEYVRPFGGDLNEFADKLGVQITEVDYQTTTERMVH